MKILMISLMFMRLTATFFSRLRKKAVSMALWTKASFCGKSLLLEQSLPRTLSWQKQNRCESATSAINYFFVPLCLSGISTTVVSALQIRPFLTNKANFQKSQMNINKVLAKDYGKMDTWSHGKNKAKTKPIQTQFQIGRQKRKMERFSQLVRLIL